MILSTDFTVDTPACQYYDAYVGGITPAAFVAAYDGDLDAAIAQLDWFVMTDGDIDMDLVRAKVREYVESQSLGDF